MKKHAFISVIRREAEARSQGGAFSGFFSFFSFFSLDPPG
jgi:hypothetical protein